MQTYSFKEGLRYRFTKLTLFTFVLALSLTACYGLGIAPPTSEAKGTVATPTTEASDAPVGDVDVFGNQQTATQVPVEQTEPESYLPLGECVTKQDDATNSSLFAALQSEFYREFTSGLYGAETDYMVRVRFKGVDYTVIDGFGVPEDLAKALTEEELNPTGAQLTICPVNLSDAP